MKKFISTYPNLQVVLQSKRLIVNEATGEKLMERHPIKIKFEFGIYQTDDQNIIGMMMKRLEETKALGLAPTYSEYPEEEGKPVVVETPKDESEQIIKIKDEIITELQNEVEDLKKQIAELSQKKKSKKFPAVAN